MFGNEENLFLNIYAKRVELKFSKIVNREKRSMEMLLYGELGDDRNKGEISGHDFARELNWLAREYDEITVRVNCNGGSVSHGLSIVSEMMASPAFIIVKVDGIAASMAAVILAAADKVVMNDYAKVMIHSPYYQDENGSKASNLSAKDQKALKVLKTMLAELLAKRGIEQDEITRLMRTDSWFTADEAKEANIADEVITTGRKKELAALEPLKLVAKIQTEKSIFKTRNMEKILARLGLDENATQEQAVEAIDKLEKEEPKPDTVLVDKLVALGKKSGRVTDKNEKKVKALAGTDMELFCDFIGIDTLGEKKGGDNDERLSALVAKAMKESGKTGGAKTDEKDFAWYEKNDPKALAKMEFENPEKFKELKEADEAKYQ